MLDHGEINALERELTGVIPRRGQLEFGRAGQRRLVQSGFQRVDLRRAVIHGDGGRDVGQDQTIRLEALRSKRSRDMPRRQIGERLGRRPALDMAGQRAIGLASRSRQ